MSRSYVTNLRKGRIREPRLREDLTLAKAMGFPPEAWFEEMPASGAQNAFEEGRDLAGRVQHLFGAVRHPKTGEAYTSADVARMSAVDLTEGEVEETRTRKIPVPAVSKVEALAAVFGVEPSYLVDREGAPPLDTELLKGLSDETTREITHGALRLSEREKKIVLGIVREFGDQGPPRAVSLGQDSG